jgi:hypothetical protein
VPVCINSYGNNQGSNHFNPQPFTSNSPTYRGSFAVMTVLFFMQSFMTARTGVPKPSTNRAKYENKNKTA